MLNEEVPQVEMNEIIKKVTATYRKLYKPTSHDLSFNLIKENGEFVYTTVSEKVRFALGLNVDLTGHKVGKLADGIILERLKSNLQKAWMGNVVVYCTKAISGLELIVHLSPVFQRNNVISIKGNFMDITKWRKLNKIVSFCDIEGNYLYTDDENEIASGYTTDTLLNGTIFTLMHPEDEETVKQKLIYILETKEAGYATYRIRKANGRWMRVNANGIPFLDENNDFLGIIIFTDNKHNKRNYS